MAEGLNKVLLLGNLGADPELRMTPGGQPVLKLRLATTETYLDRNQTRQERTEWHQVTVWGKRGEALSKIYERRGDHGQAFDTMQQLSRLLNDPQQVVDLRFRMGKLLDEQLGDRSAAVDQYQSALDVEPAHPSSPSR